MRTFSSATLSALQSGAVALVQLLKLAFTGTSIYLNSSTWDLVWQRRYNLLTYSEQFDHTPWTPVGSVSVVANNVLDPNGNMTGDQVLGLTVTNNRLDYDTGIPAANAGAYTYSVWLKGVGSIQMAINTTTGVGGTTEITAALTTTWTRYSVTWTFGSGATGNVRLHGVISRDGSGPTVWMWGAQLEPGELASTYTPTTTTALTDPGITYKGAYGLGQISAITDKPGEVQGITLELHGADAARISLALDDSDIVQGSPVEVRTALIETSTYQILDAPVEWLGTMDTMSIAEDGTSATIAVTCESRAVDLLRGNVAMYSDADQRAINAADGAFSYVVDQIDKPIVWPNREFFYK